MLKDVNDMCFFALEGFGMMDFHSFNEELSWVFRSLIFQNKMK